MVVHGDSAQPGQPGRRIPKSEGVFFRPSPLRANQGSLELWMREEAKRGLGGYWHAIGVENAAVEKGTSA